MRPDTRPTERPSDLRVVWIYPDLLSTYGDQGNALVLERRATLRGFGVDTVYVHSDEPVPREADIYLMGGGEDRPQILAAQRLGADGNLAKVAEAGKAILAVCAGYQIIGTEFAGDEGQPLPGVGILDIHSVRAEQRAVGEIAGDVDPSLGVPRITGFENHGGLTRLGPSVRPLATTIVGIGNGDGSEGVVQDHIIGTYMHGPALVRNPGLADLLLGWVVGDLEPIDDTWVEKLREERLAAVTGDGTADG